MSEMNRRDFLKTVAIGGAVLSLGKAVFSDPLEALASGKYDIGQCKSVRVKCISELGWFDTKNLLVTLTGGKGPEENQWQKPWDYLGGLEKYFNDHFGFRPDLIRWNCLLRMRLLGTSPIPIVILFPEITFARWFTLHTCASLWIRAMSVSAVILFTVSDAESLKSCRVADRSFQNGIFTSRPPCAAIRSNASPLSTMPDSPKRDSSAVRSMAYFSNSVGMIMSATAVLAIFQSPVVTRVDQAAALSRAANCGSDFISFICSVRFQLSLRNGFFTDLLPTPPEPLLAAPPPAFDSNR